MLKHLSDLSEVDDYLRFVGRVHDCAGVDPRFLNLTGLVFCQVNWDLCKVHNKYTCIEKT